MINHLPAGELLRRMKAFPTKVNRDTEGETGIQQYFERFPNQLKVMYDGKKGFLYSPISVIGLKNTKDHSWESPVDVPVVLREHIENVYEAILAEEKAGNVIIHRYEEIDPAEQKIRADKLREYVMNNPQLTYREFIIKHFSPLWD